MDQYVAELAALPVPVIHPGKYGPICRISSGQLWKQSLLIATTKIRGFKTKLVFRSSINSGLFSCLSGTVFKQSMKPKN